MNKREMLKHLSDETGCSKTFCEKMISLMTKGIAHGLKTDGKVQLAGFGTFEVRSRKAHQARHPQTGKNIHISETKTVGFRPGTELKIVINKNGSK